MVMIGLFSAKGSPGVTTTVVGLALAWGAAHQGRSALAIDADPIGGDVAAGVLRGGQPPSCGVLPLATSRGVPPIEAVESAAVALCRDGTARLIAGVPDAARAAALTLAWDVLGHARPELDAAGTDLLVDAGRIDPTAPTAPWVRDCDLGLLVVRPTLPGVTAARRLLDLADPSRPAHGGDPGREVLPSELALVVVESPSPYRASEVADALDLPLLATLAFDPRAARVHAEGVAASRGFARSGYARGLAGLAVRIGERLPPCSDASSKSSPMTPESLVVDGRLT